MRACSGTWIAHGSGTADREVVDGTTASPCRPESRAYRLRRVWLTEEEEAVTTTASPTKASGRSATSRTCAPCFATSDWEKYTRSTDVRRGRRRGSAKSSDPIVLVQDYHFALLPRMIREMLPQATIITFWHIPWPNPEAFAHLPVARARCSTACSGSSILGFHTQFHCNNFLDTVDRLLEARVDRETFTVSYRGKLTAVKRYPISIEWPPAAEAGAYAGRGLPHGQFAARHALPRRSRGRRRRRSARLHQGHRGAISRRRAAARAASGVGRAFHFRPDRGADRARHRGVPRTIENGSVRRSTDESMQRFGGDGPPADHPDRRAPRTRRRSTNIIAAADLCFVSSLHDGMNLVAKEFVAARDDERGVLMLSQFTGAARELPEAMIVNPYDADQCASALAMRARRCRNRTARAHAADARTDRGIQRLPLGRPHAD